MASTSSAADLIERFRAWAERTPDVYALAIVGSHARAHDPADEWSDVDLVIVADDADRYLGSGTWLEEIGRCRLTFVEESPLAGLYERRAHFEEGREFDLVVITPEMLEVAAGVPDAADLAARGWRVLVDKQHLAERFATQLDAHRGVSTPVGPSEDEITDAAARFWHGCIWTARKLRRGELWVATVNVNCGLHQLLLQVLEWEAQTRPTGAADAWFRGRFLERWADPNAQRRLPTTFATCERRALARALEQIAALYSDLISEVGARVGASPPRDIESYGAGLVKTILSN